MASVYFVQDCGSHVQVLREKPKAPPPPPPHHPFFPEIKDGTERRAKIRHFQSLNSGEGVIILRLACQRLWVLLHVLSQTAVNSIYLHHSGRSQNSLPYMSS